MNCKKVRELLSDYIDGELKPDICNLIETHIAKCNSCAMFLTTLKKTIKLIKSLPEIQIPPEVSIRLHERLKAYRKTEKPQ